MSICCGGMKRLVLLWISQLGDELREALLWLLEVSSLRGKVGEGIEIGGRGGREGKGGKEGRGGRGGRGEGTWFEVREF